MYTLTSNVLSESGYNEQDINSVLTEGLSGLGRAFLELEQQYEINALFAASHAAIESGWGTSYLATTKHNLFGIGAFDTHPEDAYAFTSFEENILYYGNFLKTNYLETSGTWYAGGTTIHDIFVHYSSSHDAEAQLIANLMNQLVSSIATTPSPVLSSQPHTDYTIQPGDTLSGIAAKFGISSWNTLYQFDGNNGIIGPNPNLIRVGTVIHIPEGATVQNDHLVRYIVEKGDTLWAIAQTHLGNGARYTEIAKLNGITNPNLIHIGQILILPNK